jgi:GT2 family glycosyltransferase
VNDKPFISIIVPVHNGGRYFDACLSALAASTYAEYEVIVVDDASNDQLPDTGGYPKAKALRLDRRQGPAAARNLGAAHATGELLFFIDVDVLVKPETLELVSRIFLKHPHISAVFGSYDTAPAEPNFFSQYKNLYHHFVHQRSRPEAGTFWSGCGAITREAFNSVGGFDAARFAEPSVEDIELGYRLSRNGFQIRLEKSLQVKHLKRWTLGSLLHADIFRRALPWSKLILENRDVPSDLNLTWSDRVSALLAGLMLVAPFALGSPSAAYVEAFLSAAILILNYELYSFFVGRRGVVFAAMVFPMQVLYYWYSSFAFLFCLLTYRPWTRSAVNEARTS